MPTGGHRSSRRESMRACSPRTENATRRVYTDRELETPDLICSIPSAWPRASRQVCQRSRFVRSRRASVTRSSARRPVRTVPVLLILTRRRPREEAARGALDEPTSCGFAAAVVVPSS